jgi:beta-lactamase regulating signal transducer with metallopeptidase domain
LRKLNLKLDTKIVDVDVRKIKTKIIFEMGKPEMVIPKKIRKSLNKELKKYLEKEKNNGSI